MESSEPEPETLNNEESAESLETVDNDNQQLSSSTDATSVNNTQPSNSNAPKKQNGLKQFFQRFNIYLLLFVLILVVAAVIIIISYFQSQKVNNVASISSQGLTSSALKQLANSDATVGDPKQILNIQSNAVFAGQVLVRQGLQIAGKFQVSGTVLLEGLNVPGDAALGQAEIGKNLSVGGNTAIQGQTTIAQNLQVGGSGVFSGSLSAPQITTTNLQLNGDLILNHHLITGGGSPSKSDGSGALGNGGTASVGGSDSAGLIHINTGNNPTAGCFVTIGFTSHFTSSPYVIVTPVGASAGGLAYYINTIASSFSVCDATTPPAGATFGFTYFVAG